VIGLSDAEFWDMTPRSYAAVQRAYSRIVQGGETDAGGGGDGGGHSEEATQARIFGHFAALAGQQQARKAADGAP
jgi:hypothetical protein